MADTNLRDMRPYLRRLMNPVTGHYLHLSGSGETDGTALAWSGTREQARNLRARAEGQHFPYVLVPLNSEKAKVNDAEHI